ncbi:hypothetical protein AGR2A_pb20045 [Agrobacterium genomosp. 2 str. CFBP 5494]|uniref:Uncharacterized protein n=1 Tax=Agrobacterium genomosp. 2 str. CFBP 5494 TaxID=1183436 RepID=A0A9W5B828_9HYPH|nr:hypothetical protein AGR2A_pb20045 [Agrobacterium genomosp. 2 str. CFBP 5494]
MQPIQGLNVMSAHEMFVVSAMGNLLQKLDALDCAGAQALGLCACLNRACGSRRNRRAIAIGDAEKRSWLPAGAGIHLEVARCWGVGHGLSVYSGNRTCLRRRRCGNRKGHSGRFATGKAAGQLAGLLAVLFDLFAGKSVGDIVLGAAFAKAQNCIRHLVDDLVLFLRALFHAWFSILLRWMGGMTFRGKPPIREPFCREGAQRFGMAGICR